MTDFVGTAGWSIPAALADRFPREGTHLERYAARLNAVEINSSFYRPHRRSTYERWAASVPAGFRFAVKLPRAITHDARLVGCGDLLDRFAGEVAGLGAKRGPVLVQLPPSLVFEAEVAAGFFTHASATVGGALACEPRHPSWFGDEADALLASHGVARIAADPARVPAAALPGAWRGLAYARWHGSPRLYWSDYDAAAIEAHAALARSWRSAGAASWTIYDNTAAGHALANALMLAERL